MQLKAPITYNIYDGDKLVFKTKSATKASDYRVTNGKHLSIMAIDSIGNTKKLYADGGGVGELKVGDKVELRIGGDSKRGVVVSPPSNGKVSVEVEFTDVLSKRLTKMKMAFPISSIHKLSTMANGGGVETESTLRKRFEGYTDEELQIYNGDNAETLKNWNRKDAIQEAIDAVNEEGEEEEKFTYKDIYTSQGGMTFETEEEVKKFIKRTKPFIRKQLKEGNFVVVFNGKEYYIAEKIKHNEYAKGTTIKGFGDTKNLIGKQVKVDFRRGAIGTVIDYDNEWVTVDYPTLGFAEKVNLKTEQVTLVGKFAKGSTIKGKSASFYLSSHKEMFDDNAKTITKKDIADFIIISKNSDKKYWVKDINTKYSYYIYKGDLRLNDGTGGIFSTTKIGLDRLKDEHKFKIKEENLYDWEKELEKDMLKRADPNYKKPIWETIVDKFNDIYFLEGSLISNYKENKLSSSEVKARGSNNGYYSYEFRNFSPLLSWKEAEDKFKKSLKADELNSIEISYKKEEYADLEEHDAEKYHIQIFVKLKKYANGGGVGILEQRIALAKKKSKVAKDGKYFGSEVYLVLQHKTDPEEIFVISQFNYNNDRHNNQWNDYNIVFKTNEYANGGVLNGNYLDTISNDKKNEILKNIANNYGISVAEAKAEVIDADAEMLYEYIANDKSLKMSVYNDFEYGKFAKGTTVKGGGGEGEFWAVASGRKLMGAFPNKKPKQSQYRLVGTGHGWNIKPYAEVQKEGAKDREFEKWELVKEPTDYYLIVKHDYTSGRETNFYQKPKNKYVNGGNTTNKKQKMETINETRNKELNELKKLILKEETDKVLFLTVEEIEEIQSLIYKTEDRSLSKEESKKLFIKAIDSQIKKQINGKTYYTIGYTARGKGRNYSWNQATEILYKLHKMGVDAIICQFIPLFNPIVPKSVHDFSFSVLTSPMLSYNSYKELVKGSESVGEQGDPKNNYYAEGGNTLSGYSYSIGGL